MILKTIELFLIGFAAVIDVALLLVVFDRANRARVAIWLCWLVAASAVSHGAIFARLLLVDVTNPAAAVADQSLMVLLCIGLIAMPSAMLHAALRLLRTGTQPQPPMDRRYALLYLPLLTVPAIASEIWQSHSRDFLGSVGQWRSLYLVWTMFVNTMSMMLFLQVRRQVTSASVRVFVGRLVLAVGTISVLAFLYAMVAVNSAWEPCFRLAVVFSPAIVSLLFVWHTLRGSLMPLVMDRSLAYGAMLLAFLLAHRLLVSPTLFRWWAQTGIDFQLVEGIAIAVLIVLWRPLRARVAESLHYLFGSNVFQVRTAIRALSVSLSRNASRPVEELIPWFAEELRSAIGLEKVTILIDSASLYCSPPPAPALTDLTLLRDAVLLSGSPIERGAATTIELEETLTRADALVVFPLAYQSVRGAVVIGNLNRKDRLAREQVNALAVVVEQFAATIENRREESRRQQTHRKLLQQEKLSALGLVSGSIAHELRNPLSSMRTITALVAEELGADHTCHADLRLVITEIDRLNQTSQRLLDFARPPRDETQNISPDPVIHRIVCVLEHLANQHHIGLRVDLNCEHAKIASSESNLGEIVFNLTKNAIEAAMVRNEHASSNGFICVQSNVEAKDVVISIADNGPGVAPQHVATLFQPFASHKPDGTGLGLYAVNERVRELGGTIAYVPLEPRGAKFEVRFNRVSGMALATGSSQSEPAAGTGPLTNQALNDQKLDIG